MLRLMKFLKPYALMIFVLLACIFLQTLGDLYLPTLMAKIINEGVMKGNFTAIMDIGRVMLLVAGGSALVAVLASFLSAKIAVGFGTILRSQVFKRVESFSLNEFEKFGTATLITRTTNDINQVQMVTMVVMRMMVSAPMMAVGGIILAFQQDIGLTWVLAVALPVLALVIALIATRVMPMFRMLQEKIDKINLIIKEKLSGMRVIRAFNALKREEERFNEANEDLTNTYIKVNQIMAFMMPSIMLVMNFTTLAILWFGGIRVSQGNMNLGALTAFTQYAILIMMSMIMLSMMFVMVPRAQAAAVRINEVLDTVPQIREPKKPKEVDKGKGKLEFNDVTFCYPGAEAPLLQNISFSAGPGQITAIIGSTGSGKSTLVNLIPRFYDVNSGSIKIDGVDIREMALEQLRSKIGFVPQKAVLFSGSIRDNIKFGNEEATEEEIIHSTEVAQALDFINSFEDGFDHQIAQGGLNLSGGQKQRLAIARALVRKCQIYIFDDSFSALDFKTDARLRKALNEEIREAAVIIVAQRVSTIMDADRIIVLDKGKIAGMGTHKELLKTCEVYREIVSSQLSEEEIA
ncbi:MAG: ABC transporter ATP-binding protein [Clostridia bacterium]|nr:ABC transporter ATP-binding protein [Clostridia bacterium]